MLDIRHLHRIGLDSYRFSLNWSRLLPEGTGRINPAGVGFDDRLIDELLTAGIAPNVTLYHWNLPRALQDRDGWPNRDVIDWVRFPILGNVAQLRGTRPPNQVSEQGNQRPVHRPLSPKLDRLSP